MGKIKEETKKKTKDLHIRLTERDMELIRRNCVDSGYKSLTRYVTRSLIYRRPKARRRRQSSAQAGDLQWLQEELVTLVRQVRGAAANYNQMVTIFNTLVKNVEDKKVQSYIIRRAARLDTLSREMVSALGSIRDLIGSIVPPDEDEGFGFLD